MKTDSIEIETVRETGYYGAQPTKIPPLPARGQGVKYENFERNVLIVGGIFIVVVLALLAYWVTSFSHAHPPEHHIRNVPHHAIDAPVVEDFPALARELREEMINNEP